MQASSAGFKDGSIEFCPDTTETPKQMSPASSSIEQLGAVEDSVTPLFSSMIRRDWECT